MALPVLAALFVGLFPSLSHAQVTKGIFAVDCFYSHSAHDDPIVKPGQPGAAHLHDFYGNRSPNAFSTESSMRAASTKCKDLDDKAGYWNPAGYMPSGRLLATRIAVYYVNDLAGSVETIPAGLQMVGGNSAAAPAGGAQHVYWFCGVAVSPFRSHPYECSGYDGGEVTGRVDFPTCWDGNGLTPAHTGYAGSFPGGVCPSGWHTIPRVSYRVHFGILDPCAGASPCGPDDPDTNIKLTLAYTVDSTGPYTTLHADFWNTWNQTALGNLVQACDNAHVDCGKIESSPTLPTNPSLSATAGNGSVNLSWTTPGSNGGSTILGYDIYRGTVRAAEMDTPTPPPTPINSAPVTGTSFTDSGLTPGTEYSYRVAAVNSVGEGRPSNEASATPISATAPGSPGLSATAGNAVVHLSWNAPSNGGAAITNYKVYRGTTSGGETLLTTLGNVTSYDDTGVANTTTYFYKVSAVNSVGEGGLSNEASATPQTASAPAAPTVTAKTTRGRVKAIVVSWTVPSNNGSPITEYRIYRSPVFGSATYVSVNGTTTSYKDTAITAGTYCYQVSAVNSAGEGPRSSSACATV